MGIWDFLQKLFSKSGGEVTVVVLDESEPELSSTFRLKSADILKVAVVVVAVSILITTVIFFITPLGFLYQRQHDDNLRQEVMTITDKVIALQDSLEARDHQLAELKQVLVETPDTTFSTRFRLQPVGISEASSERPHFSTSEIPAYEMLSRNEIIYSDILNKNPDFPTFYPVEGTLTQGFNVDERHMGIDIASSEQTEFKAIADGTVVNAGWTVQYGYVIYLQHGEGFMSVYKHGATLLKEVGDIVLQGDILGTVGDQGAFSFGPHLHLEIWKNGVAQDPRMYLIK